MIDSKNAISRASAYFTEVFPQAKQVQLEEIELSEDRRYWLVTFSFPKPELTIFGALVANPNRDYKTVKVDAATGEPVGVKIRALTS